MYWRTEERSREFHAGTVEDKSYTVLTKHGTYAHILSE